MTHTCPKYLDLILSGFTSSGFILGPLLRSVPGPQVFASSAPSSLPALHLSASFFPRRCIHQRPPYVSGSCAGENPWTPVSPGPSAVHQRDRAAGWPSLSLHFWTDLGKTGLVRVPRMNGEGGLEILVKLSPGAAGSVISVYSPLSRVCRPQRSHGGPRAENMSGRLPNPSVSRQCGEHLTCVS